MQHSCFSTPMATPMVSTISTSTPNDVSATPLSTGALIPLILIIVALPIVVVMLVLVLVTIKHKRIDLKCWKSTTKAIPTDTNVAYGLTHQDTESNTGMQNGAETTHDVIYKYPVVESIERRLSETMADDEAYVHGSFAARDKTENCNY